MVDEKRTLSGRYEVGDLIGRGGMAEVHIGRDTRLGRTVAIKILRSDLARDPAFQSRFRREAQAAASLNHPAIVAVYDTGEDIIADLATGVESHVPFIVMEYVEGHTVRDILKDGAAVAIDEAIEITQGVLSALEYSHRAGIVHRDIKPANIMLTPTGSVKVMDFGIARALADSAATMTQTSAVVGTAQYLSPEQARGETVDARSDLYSVGCVLFELLTGRPPFIGDSAVSVAYQHVREAPPKPSSIASDVSDTLDKIVFKGLAKDRNARYSTAAEFRADLERALRGESVSEPVAGAVAPLPDTEATQVFNQTDFSSPTAGPATAQFAAAAAPPSFDAVLAEQEDGALLLEEEEKKKNIWLWVLIGVAVTAIAVMLFFIFGRDGSEPEATDIAVPSLTGLNEEEAKAKLVEAGFTTDPKITPEASDTIPAGIFIKSAPDAGQSIPKDTLIELFFSTGPSSKIVPNVSNQDQARAIAELERNGFKDATQRISEDHITIPEGWVTRTDPAADAEISPEQEITVYISTGLVQIEDYVNKATAEEASEALSLLELSVRIVPQASDEEPGTIIEQSPAAGRIPQRSTVTLVIAEERQPELVQVPSLAGKTEAQAQSELQALGLQMRPIYEYDATVPKGQVVSTTPGTGVSISKGGDVQVLISQGPEPTPGPEPSNGPEPTPSQSQDPADNSGGTE